MQKQIADATVAFQTPILVGVGGDEVGQVLDGHAISRNQTLFCHLAHEHSGNVLGRRIGEFDACQEVVLESDVAGQDSLQVERGSSEKDQRIPRRQDAGDFAERGTSVIAASWTGRGRQQRVCLLQHQHPTRRPLQHASRLLDGPDLGLSVDEIVAPANDEVAVLDGSDFEHDMREDAGHRGLAGSRISLQSQVMRRYANRRLVAFVHLDRPAQSTNLVLYRFQANQLGESNLDDVIRRTESIFDQLRLIFVVVAVHEIILSHHGWRHIGSRCFPDLVQHGLNSSGLLWNDSRRVQSMPMTFVDVHQDRQHGLHLLARSLIALVVLLHLLLQGLEAALGGCQDFVIGRRNRLSLQQCHHVRRRAVGNGKIQRGVVVVILLRGTFRVGVVQRLHDLQRCVVMRGVMQREIAVVVLLRGAFRVDLQEELFNVKWTLLPCREVQGKIPVVVGHGCGLRIRLEQRFRNFQRGTEGCCRVQRQVASVILHLRLMLGGRIDCSRDGSLPSLGDLMQVGVLSRSGHFARCSTIS
mmetsp:Transcript_27128/g.76321  ORF Transcript_27128/g.76321 Transcript_27128/m.76321 type:complete len:527 (+) Transcript_27128:342-1922(+)